MAITVRFTFHSGIKRPVFSNVRLCGSWDAAGRFANQWTQLAMSESLDETGCAAFSASVSFDPAQVGTTFEWGVLADLAPASNTWAIATEVADQNSDKRVRSFSLAVGQTQQDYWFATGRRFGAQKFTPIGASQTGIRFAVWAPNALRVDVVFAPFDAATATGYISDDGAGIEPASPVIPLTSHDGVWEANPLTTPALADFNDYFHRLYMYRITNEQGAVTYKVDIFSRNQVGRGDNNPQGGPYAGTYLDLDGIVSCSVVSDPDQVARDFNDTGIEKSTLIAADDFWKSEFNAGQ